MASRARRSGGRCSISPPRARSSSSVDALTRLDSSQRLDLHALLAPVRRRHRGNHVLEWAIANHDPRFAHTRSPLEDDWLICCEQLDIPKPDDVNVVICGISVDTCYYDAKLVVEFDGADNHRSPAQVRRDRRNEFKLRKGRLDGAPLQL